MGAFLEGIELGQLPHGKINGILCFIPPLRTRALVPLSVDWYVEESHRATYYIQGENLVNVHYYFLFLKKQCPTLVIMLALELGQA